MYKRQHVGPPGEHDAAVSWGDRVIEVTEADRAWWNEALKRPGMSPREEAACRRSIEQLDRLECSVRLNSYTLLAGSPAIDVGNPNAFYNDGDGSRNEMGYTGGNGFVLSATEIDFGYVGVGDSRNKTITISNTNPDGIQITGASFDDSQFTTSQSFPLNMSYYSTADIQFTFTPSMTGAHWDTLQLSSPDIIATNTYGEFALSGNAFDLSDGVVQVPGEVPTIQGAIDASSNGDTVLVAAGTYVENIEIDKEIVVIGADRETTIIDGDSSGSVVYFGSNAGMDTYFSGFTIKMDRECMIIKVMVLVAEESLLEKIQHHCLTI